MMSDCIVLNKAFCGKWLNDDENNIAHEVINFFKADDGNIYAYCAPHGQTVPEHDVKYLLLTSNVVGGKCNLLYCYEIKKTLHKQKKISGNAKEKTVKENIKKAKDEISKNLGKSFKDVKYGGYDLEQLFGSYSSVYPFTFLVEKVWQAREIIEVKEKFGDAEDGYDYRRNFGYAVKDDPKRGPAYKELSSLLPSSKPNSWKDITDEITCFQPLDSTDETQKRKVEAVKSNLFMDLIDNYKAEECYTKMLHKLFRAKPDLIKKLIAASYGKQINDGFETCTETKVDYGRIDLFSYSENSIVILENKVDADFTMRKEKGQAAANSISQLKRYYEWSISKDGEFIDNAGKKRNPRSFANKYYLVLTPDYRFDFVVYKEQSLRNKEDFEEYKIVPYSSLYEIVKDVEIEDFKFQCYLNDIKLLLLRLSLKTSEYYVAKLSCRISQGC